MSSTPPVIVMNTNNPEEFPKESLSSSFPSRTMPIQIKRVSRPNSMQNMDPETYQRQLDSQLDKVDFNDITVSELKELLRQRGKPATGKKAVLLQRLQEERELAKGGRSPVSSRIISNRHSQPLPFSRSLSNYNYPESSQQQSRPRSFQGSSSISGSSPVMIQSNNGPEPGASSPSIPSFLSPGSPGGQLHRSIANMHIGSPPATSRRYSPYSPRLSSSPKPTYEYSSSVPLSSSPNLNNNVNNTNINTNNNNNNMMLSSSYSTTRQANRYFNSQKSYKPFTSSALATPDREEDINPFDSYYANDPPIKEEEASMDWSDPAILDLILQQGTHNMDIAEMIGQPLYSDDVVLTNEQIMALLNTQQAYNFKLDDSYLNNS
ncbi:MAG: hypothetical protein EXX96DRAFT_586416 [Benjaminiella poitrasii]|nr:MAG: hypothetical protein EXX96DRAFT_586416 [Benjaminiella poitrasii]